MTEQAVTVLSSMATRGALDALAGACPESVAVESVGGVLAAQRVRAGEAVDIVVLGGDVMHALAAEGHLVAASLADFAIASMVAAVREGTLVPDLSSEAAVRAAILAAPRTGYSTGPSGQHLLRLVERWGIREQLGERLVQAPPGVPVGTLLRDGKVDLAMQQQSEFLNIAGVVVAGKLPPPIHADTVFTIGLAASAPRAAAARRVVAFFTSPEAAEAKRRHGLQPPAR